MEFKTVDKDFCIQLHFKLNLVIYPLLRSRDGKPEGSSSEKKMQQIGMTEKGPPAEQTHANGGKICYEPLSAA